MTETGEKKVNADINSETQKYSFYSHTEAAVSDRRHKTKNAQRAQSSTQADG